MRQGLDLVAHEGVAWAPRTKAGRAEDADIERVEGIGEPLAIQPPTERVLTRFLAAAAVGAIGAVVVGYHALLGALFGIPALRSPGVGPPMTASEALALVLAGLALWALRGPRDAVSLDAERLASICTAGATALGLVALVEHAAGAGPDVSMALVSAVAIVIVGVSLLFLEARKPAAAEIFGVAAGAFSLQALTRYLYGAAPVEGQMPLYTAVAGLLFTAGLLFAHPTQGFMARVASDSFGGLMARRLLPATLLIPIVLGWLQIRGELAGLHGFESGQALFALINVAVFVTVVWWSVRSLYRMDWQRREAERELKETAAKLQRSNADLEQFAYVTSHDLKEPLRAISGSIQVLQARFSEHLDPEVEEFVRHTVDGANRMQTLIDDLLTYSRLTTREAPVEPTDSGAVLREALENLAAPLEESRAVVTTDPLPTVPADRVQLLQVFQNLVSNALKYRSERTPKIHVSADDLGWEWRFSVRDNGIGIAPQYADRIFKIFQRLHTRKDYPGTGIGLAICKKVIERHGGRIWVESEPEEGSTFFFTLPK